MLLNTLYVTTEIWLGKLLDLFEIKGHCSYTSISKQIWTSLLIFMFLDRYCCC